MFLQKLQLQGFKSFVYKTNLEFTKGITAIMGPNGSGKTNIVDAIRWVLGEQSMKLLRGKKSEDIIFAGSDKKARLGFTEVSLHLNNEDNQKLIDYREIVISRRLYRDGESEYLINKAKVRLQDILLLLAKARFAQKSYSIIGQGMIDSILTASPEERKAFFEEAAGIKEYQIKQEEALHKLDITKKNLEQAELVLQEITPHLRSLSRQAKKIERRKEIEEKLRSLQQIYYHSLWQEIEGKIKFQELKIKNIEKKYQEAKEEIKKIQTQLESLEKGTEKLETYNYLQKEYEELLEEKNRLKEKELIFKNEIDSIQKGEKKSSYVLSSQIIQSLEEIKEELIQIEKLEELKVIKRKNKDLQEKLTKLINEIKGPLPDKEIPSPLLKNLEDTKESLEEINEKIENIRRKIFSFGQKEEEERKWIFDLQRKDHLKQEEFNKVSKEMNEIEIELAKLETKREDLESEIERELGNKEQIKVVVGRVEKDSRNEEELRFEIYRLKHQLELIGGIDPEVIKEYNETKERFEFLSQQSGDLKEAIKSLEKVIEELNQTIKKQFESSFKKINEEFGKYFRILFNGGLAKLAFLKKESLPPIKDKEKPEDEDLSSPEDLSERLSKIKSSLYSGIEIQVTPPGKRIKNVNILSGGERALTSIALICAILDTNPSPFVILDEVDAALDEANSAKFAEILENFSKKIQFVVITHNRITMEKAKVLYGVTMGDDGISRLLSVKLEDLNDKQN